MHYIGKISESKAFEGVLQQRYRAAHTFSKLSEALFISPFHFVSMVSEKTFPENGSVELSPPVVNGAPPKIEVHHKAIMHLVQLIILGRMMQLISILTKLKVQGGEWNVQACRAAIESSNPIRELLESLHIVPSTKKATISLAQGDPTAFGHMTVPDAAVEAMVAVTKSSLHNGYTHSAGSPECRK